MVQWNRDGAYRRLPRGGRGSQLPDLCHQGDNLPVASREGGVDRNRQSGPDSHRAGVASREGGVDRNQIRATPEGEDPRRLPRGGRGSQQDAYRNHC